MLAAEPAAQRVLNSVSTNRPTAADDLTVLGAARAAFVDAVARLHAAGSEVKINTGAAVRAALSDLAAAADDAPVRAGLRQLQSLIAPAENAMPVAALTAARHRAADLAASPMWTAGERAAAVTLGTLNKGPLQA
ncbi:hypothetical protein [Pseudonocardia humida]|uniref:hypothetical protein n=1 Tax=Pseudonocardia humida TaxID=2800819 RepID=UPI00207D55AB|nr:hypothetical protein [Pseudonocardia humida]